MTTWEMSIQDHAQAMTNTQVGVTAGSQRDALTHHLVMAKGGEQKGPITRINSSIFIPPLFP